MAGLIHPRDLEAWRHWQRSRQPWTRYLKQRSMDLGALIRGSNSGAQIMVTVGGPHPRVLVCLDSRGPTSVAALLAPIRHLDLQHVAVVSSVSIVDLLPKWSWTETQCGESEVATLMRSGAVALALGNYLRLGQLAHGTAQAGRFVTVQHGLVTPFAPPLAPDTHLLAMSEADADFWRSGRSDVTTTVVGSQLLWEGGAAPLATPDPTRPPVFLGQLHGAELPREVLASTAHEFCLATGALYRPHPSERDRRSLAAHAQWERAGVTIDRTGIPLRELGAPVVSIFSTGVLEAAAAGLPAWVHLPDPPAWIQEFWARYGLSSWGGPATPPPGRPEIEPSRAIGALVQEMMDA